VAAGGIVLGALLARIGEEVRRRSIFHQRARAEKGGALRDTRRLLHIMGDDGDRVAAFLFVNQFPDPGGRDRVEREAGLVRSRSQCFSA
jgi:hypothetical protein